MTCLFGKRVDRCRESIIENKLFHNSGDISLQMIDRLAENRGSERSKKPRGLMAKLCQV